jgi:hypothetical protein
MTIRTGYMPTLSELKECAGMVYQEAPSRFVSNSR